MSRKHKEYISKAIQLVVKLKCVVDSIMQNIGEKDDELIIKKIRRKVKNIERKLEKYLKILPNLSLSNKGLSRNLIKKWAKQAENLEKNRTRIIFEKFSKIEFSKFSILPTKCFRLENSLQAIGDIQTRARNNEIRGLVSLKFITLKFKDHFKIVVKFDLDLKIKLKCFKGIMKKIKCRYTGNGQVNFQILANLFLRFCKVEFKVLAKNLVKCIERAAMWVESRKALFESCCGTCNNILSFYTGQPLLPLWLENSRFYHLACFFDTANGRPQVL
jgi:hypothetical protein